MPYIILDDSQNPQGHAHAYQYALPLGGPLPNTAHNHNAELMKDPLQRQYMVAQIRDLHARARANEAKVFLDALQELRCSLQSGAIDEGDTGTTERPPVKSAFDDINSGKIQQIYLNMFERYDAYTKLIADELANYHKIPEKKPDSNT